MIWSSSGIGALSCDDTMPFAVVGFETCSATGGFGGGVIGVLWTGVAVVVTEGWIQWETEKEDYY